jgi:hypothetical protein
MTRRQVGLNKIKYAGYHGGPTYHLLAIEYRISYEAAKKKYAEGRQARLNGVECGCAECAMQRPAFFGVAKKQADAIKEG